MIPHPLSIHAVRFPHNDAIIWAGRSLSWQRLEGYVRATAKQLKEIGVRENMRVALVGKNSVSYVVLLYALWELRASAVLIDVYLPINKMKALVDATTCRMVFTEAPFKKVFSVKTVMMGDVATFDVVGSFFHVAPLALRELDPCREIVVTASLDHEEAKLVLCLFGAMYDNARIAAEMDIFSNAEQWTLGRPLFSVSGLSTLLMSLVLGGAVVISE